ncbi:transposase [Streptomyces sp. NPDC127039]|uniref:IS110 family transposase n=1 Tax=Streptomyces sp. NPDC127039 TaxID=3347115 RepID=UPI00365EC76B
MRHDPSSPRSGAPHSAGSAATRCVVLRARPVSCASRLIGIRDTPLRGPISELSADVLTTGQVLRAHLRSTPFVYMGWDGATEAHDVTVTDNTGARVHRWELAHTEEGITKTPARLRLHGAPEDLAVAIETSRGLVVDRLLRAGHPIVPVQPNAFHAMRPRWGASKAKTDAGDSHKLADYLRTDGHLLPRLEPTDQATMDIQALTRQRADHIEARIAAVNQLVALLDMHWPGGKAVFSGLASDIPLALLERCPTPASAAKLTAGRLEAWCKRRGHSGERPGSELIERLRSAPRGVPAQRTHRHAAGPRPGPPGQGRPRHDPWARHHDRHRRRDASLRAPVRLHAAHRQGQRRPDHW